MTPPGYQQPPQFLPPQQHFSAPTGMAAASTAPSSEAEPPVPGTEDGAAAKAPSKAVAKPSYSSAPVLRAAAAPADEGATQQVDCYACIPE